MTRRLKLKFDNEEDEVVGKYIAKTSFLRLRETISKILFLGKAHVNIEFFTTFYYKL